MLSLRPVETVGTKKKQIVVLVCEFLREAMKRFLREHQTGDIFEFITSTVIQSRFVLVSTNLPTYVYIIPFIFCLVTLQIPDSEQNCVLL